MTRSERLIETAKAVRVHSVYRARNGEHTVSVPHCGDVFFSRDQREASLFAAELKARLVATAEERG